MARILVTEDEPIIAADLADRLEEAGHHVRLAHDSATCLRLIGEELPDLLLMDVHLGDGPDGIDTVQLIRKRYGDLPLVFLTSNTDRPTFQRARALQPRAFLTKPFRGRDLLNTVELTLDVPGSPTSAAAPEDSTPEGGERDFTDRLFIKHKERQVRVFIRDILYVAADDYYCRLVTTDQEYLVTKTLKKFAATLPESAPFFRPHRSYLINLDRVTEIGEIFVFLGKHEVPISRAKREELRSRLRKG